MSMVAFAARVCLVRLLRGATLAGENVADSPLDPVAQTVAAKSPLIHVYSESETLKLKNSRALLEGSRTVGLTLQVFLPVNETISLGANQIETSTRRGGGQAIFDVMYRQIEAALSITHTPNVWRDLFDAFVLGYVSVNSRPYVIQTEKGVRLAAREIEMVCDTINSPAFGGAHGDIWQGFLDAMAADPSLKPILPVVTSAVTGDVVLTQAEIDTSLLGLTNYEALAIGLDLAAPAADLGLAPGTPEAQGADEDQVSADPALAQ